MQRKSQIMRQTLIHFERDGVQPMETRQVRLVADLCLKGVQPKLLVVTYHGAVGPSGYKGQGKLLLAETLKEDH
jgi:hypothetical protein